MKELYPEDEQAVSVCHHALVTKLARFIKAHNLSLPTVYISSPLQSDLQTDPILFQMIEVLCRDLEKIGFLCIKSQAKTDRETAVKLINTSEVVLFIAPDRLKEEANCLRQDIEIQEACSLITKKAYFKVLCLVEKIHWEDIPDVLTQIWIEQLGEGGFDICSPVLKQILYKILGISSLPHAIRQKFEAIFDLFKCWYFAIKNMPDVNVGMIPRRSLLHDLYINLQKQSILCLTGEPGIGKSHTATEYAHQYACHYIVCLMLPATSQQDLLEALVYLANSLDINTQTQTNIWLKSLFDRISAVSLDNAKPVLIVLDGVVDGALIQKFILDHINMDNIHLILTSSEPDWPSLNTYCIQGFSSEEVYIYITRYLEAGLTGLSYEKQEIVEIVKMVKLLGGYPLNPDTLARAIRYINDECGASVIEFIDRVERSVWSDTRRNTPLNLTEPYALKLNQTEPSAIEYLTTELWKLLADLLQHPIKLYFCYPWPEDEAERRQLQTILTEIQNVLSQLGIEVFFDCKNMHSNMKTTMFTEMMASTAIVCLVTKRSKKCFDVGNGRSAYKMEVEMASPLVGQTLKFFAVLLDNGADLLPEMISKLCREHEENVSLLAAEDFQFGFLSTVWESILVNLLNLEEDAELLREVKNVFAAARQMAAVDDIGDFDDSASVGSRCTEEEMCGSDGDETIFSDFSEKPTTVKVLNQLQQAANHFSSSSGPESSVEATVSADEASSVGYSSESGSTHNYEEYDKTDSKKLCRKLFLTLRTTNVNTWEKRSDSRATLGRSRCVST